MQNIGSKHTLVEVTIASRVHKVTHQQHPMNNYPNAAGFMDYEDVGLLINDLDLEHETNTPTEVEESEENDGDRRDQEQHLPIHVVTVVDQKES